MRVGGEIEAICGKCGAGWHLVIALADRRIARVECGQCGARHRYRSVEGGAAAVREKRAPRTRRGETKRVVPADESRPRRPFRMTDTYQVGDRVVHPSFGEGVVQEAAAPAKIVVLFDAGAKTLVHDRGK